QVAEQGALREDAETTASIRLLDPAIVSASFRQLQQNKQYYNFPDTLNVDRYEIDGESRDTVIAVRELNLDGLGSGQRTWVNEHTVYTHGFGVVAAYGNTTAVDGRPAFYEGGIPSTGSLGDYEPRIYFGKSLPDYSIVGSTAGTDPWELDYPDDAAGGQVNTTFPTEDVAAGPSIGNLWNQLLYSIKFGSEQILFSDRVTTDSQILYDRDPHDRVAKVAPYLTLDSQVYPAVVDGRVVWIVDGYTTANTYPYSTSEALDDATTDSLTAQSTNLNAIAPQEVNYLRNSVKATVDAYSGEVTLYSWDDEDPVLKAWSEVFPTSIHPMSEISGELMSHLRYPEDLFKVQRTLLTTYHVTNAADYYSGQDFWRNPQDPVTDTLKQPPYYLTLKMPDQDEPAFSLTSTFVPGGNSDREVLTAFLAVNAEPGNVAGERSDDYGTLRLLELPRNSTVPGPGQVQNNFDANPEVSQNLNLLRQGNSTVRSGNLLTLPVGGGLLYVQPVYVQSSQGTQFPLLQRVLVSFGDEIGFAETLDEALDQVFGGDS
ncbi:MAG: COG1615 family transporter, partial [Cellulomonadaceae bacterium]|nr:COG1615 family transporter [Cellulomonadaceae bacterium]